MALKHEQPTKAELAKLRGFLQNLKSRDWRLNNLYKIRDADGIVVTFKFNVAQAELHKNLHNLNLVEKARQEGISTYACILALDTALFRKGVNCGIVADSKQNAAKFVREKIMFAHENLPDWLTECAPGIAIKRRDFSEGGILVFQNDSKIEVAVSHVGSTLQFLHISEYGKICARDPVRAEEVKRGALNTIKIAPGNMVIIESTAEGPGGDFYMRCQKALRLHRMIAAGTEKLTMMDYRFHFLPWWIDSKYSTDPTGIIITPEMEKYFASVEHEMGCKLSPEQRAWYVKKLEEQGDAMFSQFPSTPEEPFKVAVEGAYYAKEMAKAESQGRVCNLVYNENLPVHTFWDIGRDDATAICFMQEYDGFYNWIDYYEASGENAAHYARVMAERGYIYGKHHVPHDAKVHEWTQSENMTRTQVLEALGARRLVEVAKIGELSDGIEMVRQLLNRSRFDKTKCGETKPGEGDGLINALKCYRKEYNERTESWSDRPLKTWANHGADAFRQCAQGYRSSKFRPGAKDGVRSRRLARGDWRTA